MIINALTVDVEDYFQVSAFESHIDRADWDRLECRVERNIARILELFAQHNAKATFFTLGWMAERYPELVREIVQHGHELASHGFAHQRASSLSEDQFLADITRAKSLLEDVAGVAVKGYRAPSFSIGEGNLWAFDALSRAGYATARASIRSATTITACRTRRASRIGARRACWRFRSARCGCTSATSRPAAAATSGCCLIVLRSGCSSRSTGSSSGRWCSTSTRGRSIADQPRIRAAAAKARFRHYLNLNRMEGRLARLLQDFRWGRMDAIFLGGLEHPQAASIRALLQVA